MVYEKMIEGKYINIRSVVVSDAEVTLEMRQNKEKSKFLHVVENDLGKQKDWIASQNERDGDYFFLGIDKKTGKAVGTFGVYEIRNGRGHSGRLLMYGNAFQSFEMNYLVFEFAFDYLGLNEIYGDVDEKNVSAKKFDSMFGFRFEAPIQDTDLDRMVQWCAVSRDDYKECLPSILRLLYKDGNIPVFPWKGGAVDE